MGNEEQKQKPQTLSEEMFDTIFELKMIEKSISNESKKSETESNNLIIKLKDCLTIGDYEQAKVAANDSISKKKCGRKYRLLSNKISYVARRLKSAHQMRKLTEQMKNLTQQLIGAGKMMDIDKITETLLNFERLFDDLNTGCILGDESYINPNIYDVTVNEQEVKQLIDYIAEQNGIKLFEEFDDVHLEKNISQNKIS